MTEKKGAKKLNPRKADTVTKLTDKLGRAKAFFLTDYRGLTHQQLETLKKSLKKVEGEFLVAKNTLIKLALKKQQTINNKQQMDKLEEELKNPTATLFAYGDEISAVKALADFIKATQLPKIKIGIFEGRVSGEADFKRLASLPTRDELLAMLASRLQSPIYGLHYALNWNLRKLVVALNNIKSKKPTN